MIVDAHVHVIAPGLGVGGETIPSSAVGEFFDVDRILDQTRADRVILSPWVQLLELDARVHNAALAELVSDRVAVLGAAPEMTAGELRAAMGSGLAGVEVTARVGGDYLGADRFAPFWAAAEETGALVFVHPSTRGFAGPDDFYLWNTVGNPLETTVNAAHLVMAGVMERHPRLRVLLAHGGGAILALRGRLRHAHGFQPHARSRLTESPDDSLRRFHYDTLTHDPELLRALVEFAGPERVLLGSDYPFDMGDERAADGVRAAGLGPQAEDAILGANAARLLERVPREEMIG
jgi:aminocarboxymuconate-semialdehyde decarboxylase